MPLNRTPTFNVNQPLTVAGVSDVHPLMNPPTFNNSQVFLSSGAPLRAPLHDSGGINPAGIPLQTIIGGKFQKNRGQINLGSVVSGNRKARSGVTASSAVSKLELARIKEMEKQEKILEDETERQKALAESEAQAKQEQLEFEFAKKKLAREREETRLKLEVKLAQKRLDLSQQKDNILDNKSQSSRSSVISDVSRLAVSEKVSGWLEALEEGKKRSTMLEGDNRHNQPPRLELDSKPKESGDIEAEAFVKAVSKVLDSKSQSRHEENDRSIQLMGVQYSRSFIKDLPRFDGNPADYPLFISQYEATAAKGHFDNLENLTRLQKCLVDKSPAKEAVKDLLSYPENVPAILKRLKMMFGHPDHIVTEIRAKIDNFSQLSEKNMEKLIEFSVLIGNLCSTLKTNNNEASLTSPDLIRKVMKKLPPSMQLDWTKNIVGKAKVSIEDFYNWLSPISDAAVTMMDRSMYFSWKEKSKSRKDDKHKEIKHVNVHAEKTITCPCCRGDHNLLKCKKFKAISLKRRWELMRRIQLCFKCLIAKHLASECQSEGCGVDSCSNYHHKLLHKSIRRKQSDTNSSRESSTSDSHSSSSGAKSSTESSSNSNSSTGSSTSESSSAGGSSSGSSDKST